LNVSHIDVIPLTLV